MEKKDIVIEKFNSVHNEAVSSKDIANMRVASAMFIKTFEELANYNIRAAKNILECYEGSMNYNNFLTESEAEDIVEQFMNQDGSRGPKWRDPEEFFNAVDEIGGKTECKPYYNKWALYVATNKSASDQNEVILKWVGDDKTKYLEACYELALTQLKDKDNINWIRHYYKVNK